jgi:hypothetical protein
VTAKILKHKFVSAVADGPDATQVRPSNWNDEHDLWYGIRTVAGTSDTITNDDNLSLISYTAAGTTNVSISPPSGSNMPAGWTTRLRNAAGGAGIVYLQGSGGATINGVGTIAVLTDDIVDLFSNGTANYSAIITATRGLGYNQFTGTNDFNGPTTFAGTATNDAAAAGDVGQYVEAVRLFANRFSLVNAAYSNVTTPITLSPGDWDVSAVAGFEASVTSGEYLTMFAIISDASANSGSYFGNYFFQTRKTTFTWTNGITHSCDVGPARVSLSTAKDFWLPVFANFGLGIGVNVWGSISARRRR